MLQFIFDPSPNFKSMKEVPRIINARPEAFEGGTGGKDIRMLTALVHKLVWVRQTAVETGKPLIAAENEVNRQIKQVSNGIPVTKSGGSD